MDKDWGQTGQGGSEDWIKHIAFGTALEQPVPMNISDDNGEEFCAVSMPFSISRKKEERDWDCFCV